MRLGNPIRLSELVRMKQDKWYKSEINELLKTAVHYKAKNTTLKFVPDDNKQKWFGTNKLVKVIRHNNLTLLKAYDLGYLIEHKRFYRM